MNDVQAIALAAGKGTRMNEGRSSPIPKVMFEIEGRPMIDYSIENLQQAGFEKPVVVIGYKGEMVKKYLGNKASYAWQKRQLGTGHAAACAKVAVDPKVKTILSVYGDDSAFYEPEMLKNLVKEHLKNQADMTLLTIELNDPTGLGRIVKDRNNHVKAIIEERLAATEVKKIKEINTGCYVFDSDFLWKNLPKVKKNPTGEYFLTDLVEIANKQGNKVIAFETDAAHWHGINTPEQLEKAREQMRKLNKKV